MSPLAFLPLGPEDGPRVAHLRMQPGQEAFTADPALRLGRLRPSETAFAIAEDGAVVGFLVIDRAGAHVMPGEVGLRSVLIDAARQGAGLGLRAMQALPELMAQRYPQATGIVLTVNLRNETARKVYLRAGFHDTGGLDLNGRSGPQHILRMPLPPRRGVRSAVPPR